MSNMIYVYSSKVISHIIPNSLRNNWNNSHALVHPENKWCEFCRVEVLDYVY